MISIIVLIASCKKPSCDKDVDCSEGCPDDFNGKCTAKCVDNNCLAQMIPQAEYFITDDETCEDSDNCICPKNVKGECYPMCVKDQCTFKIIPNEKEALENVYVCPKGTTCVDSFEETPQNMEDIQQQEEENEKGKDSLNRAKPTKKPKGPKTPKPTKKAKPTKKTKKPGKIRKRRPEVDGRNRQNSFNPVSIKNRQMPWVKYKGKKWKSRGDGKSGPWILQKVGTPKKYNAYYKKKKKAKNPKAKQTYPREERM